jgi:hypothetical protein
MAEETKIPDEPMQNMANWFALHQERYPSKALDVETVRTRVERLTQVAANTLDHAIEVSQRPHVNPLNDTLLIYNICVTREARVCLISAPELTAALVAVPACTELSEADALCLVLQKCINDSAPISRSAIAARDGHDLQTLHLRTSCIVRIHEARLDLEMDVTAFCKELGISRGDYGRMITLDDETVPIERIHFGLKQARKLLDPEAPNQAGATGTR